MAAVAHKPTPPDEYELTEVDDEYVAACPFCLYSSPPEKTKEQARVRVGMHLLEKQGLGE